MDKKCHCGGYIQYAVFKPETLKPVSFVCAEHKEEAINAASPLSVSFIVETLMKAGAAKFASEHYRDERGQDAYVKGECMENTMFLLLERREAARACALTKLATIAEDLYELRDQIKGKK